MAKRSGSESRDGHSGHPDGPLNGVRVLDIGTLLAGPFSATLLGDFGAEVIKVEQPGAGDSLRGSPRNGKAARPPNWMIDARNKQSVVLNLRLAAGQALLKRLVECSDVLVENFTPGTLEKWGLGWDDLRAINPSLIMVRVSGWGQYGPESQRPGYDRIALGVSGYMYPTGFPDRDPVRPAFATADYNTATFAALATLLALYERDANGGEGQMIDLALYEAPFRITSNLVAGFALNGTIRERIGNRNPGFSPAGTFTTRDGRLLQIAAGGDNVWRRLAGAMGRPELADDPRYARSRDRIERADELEDLLRKWVVQHDFEDVESLLVGEGVPAGGIYTAADIHEDAHFAARDSIVRVEDPDVGPLPMPGVIPKLMGSPGRIRHTGPAYSEHTQSVLTGLLGLSRDEIEQLATDGVTQLQD